MITLLTTSLMVTSWHDCWFQVARSVPSGDHFLQAITNLDVAGPDYFRVADDALGTTSISGAMEPGVWRKLDSLAPLARELAKRDCVSLGPRSEGLPDCRVAKGKS
jgi:hypothetical protein